jgi:Asp/Glu/hydantoin racemase
MVMKWRLANRGVKRGATDRIGLAEGCELSCTGARLKALGAECVILGCAGFAPVRARLEARLDAPVIDPTLAAVTEAAALARLGSFA